MNKNELRIGNFVGLNDSEWNGFNQFFEFMSNSEVEKFLKDDNKHAIVTSIASEIELEAYGTDLDYYALPEILPIEITEDWLLKFKFKKTNYDSYFQTKKWSDGQNIITVTDDECFVEMENTFHKRCEFVHELQNLYYALTGVELTLSST